MTRTQIPILAVQSSKFRSRGQLIVSDRISQNIDPTSHSETYFKLDRWSFEIAFCLVSRLWKSLRARHAVALHIPCRRKYSPAQGQILVGPKSKHKPNLGLHFIYHVLHSAGSLAELRSDTFALH